jgi:hypothetical protein
LALLWYVIDIKLIVKNFLVSILSYKNREVNFTDYPQIINRLNTFIRILFVN